MTARGGLRKLEESRITGSSAPSHVGCEFLSVFLLRLGVLQCSH